MTLKLHEEILLLALREHEGTTVNAAWPTALGAAVLGELLETGRAKLTTEGKKLFVDLVDGGPTGDPVLDDALGRVAAAKRRGQAATWIARFSGLKDLKHRTAAALCDRGVLRADERTLLLLFKQRIYPEVDPRPEQEIRGRLRRLLFAQTSQRDPRTLRLLSLADAGGLLPTLFEKRELKERRKWVAELVAEEPLGKKVREIVQAAQTAAIVAAT